MPASTPLIAIKKQLITIALSARAGHFERASNQERALHAGALRFIATGEAGPDEAREALKSLELEFPRDDP